MDNVSVYAHINESIRKYNEKTDKKIPIEEVVRYNDLIHHDYEHQDFHKLIQTLEEIEKKYPGVGLQYAIDYAKIRDSVILAQSDKNIINESIGRIQGFIDLVKEEKKQVIVVKEQLSYAECKRLMQRAITDYYDANAALQPVRENALIFPFLISESLTISGKIILKKNQNMEFVTLISIGFNKEGALSARFFGDKHFEKNDAYVEPFFVYHFISDDKNSYYVLSKQDLSTQRYTIKGMMIEVKDVIKLGTNASASSAISVIFATEAQPDIQNMKEEDFFKMVEGLDHEKLAKMFFNEIRHPVKFEKLLFAWLFGARYSEYPLHLLWIGNPGTAKTWTLNAIGDRLYQEPIMDCSSGTLKGLIPSFGSVNIEPGFLVRCSRIACVDEFFRCFKRGEEEAASGLLTTLLEGSKHAVGSGKHAMTEVQMTSKVVMTSNPQPQLSNVGEIVQNLDKAMLSRMCIYVQTPLHESFIKARRKILQGRPKHEVLPKHDPKLVSMTDFLTDKLVTNVDYDRVYDAYSSYRDVVVTEDIAKIYDSRYDHHFICILDGITKYNIIVEGRKSWDVTEKDYHEAEMLYVMCLSSWDPDLSDWKRLLQPESKIDLLPTNARLLHEYIKANPMTTMNAASEKLPFKPYDWIGVLREWNLVNEHIQEDKKTKKYTVK